jgi:hypothetical protein
VIVDLVVEVVVEGCWRVVERWGARGYTALQPSLTTVLAQRSERCNPKMVGYVRTVYARIAGSKSGELQILSGYEVPE